MIGAIVEFDDVESSAAVKLTDAHTTEKGLYVTRAKGSNDLSVKPPYIYHAQLFRITSGWKQEWKQSGLLKRDGQYLLSILPWRGFIAINNRAALRRFVVVCPT